MWPAPGTLLRRGLDSSWSSGKGRACGLGYGRAGLDAACHRGGRPGDGAAATSALGTPCHGRSPGLVCEAAETGVREVGPGGTWIPDPEARFLGARPSFPPGHCAVIHSCSKDRDVPAGRGRQAVASPHCPRPPAGEAGWGQDPPLLSLSLEPEGWGLQEKPRSAAPASGLRGPLVCSHLSS